MTSTPKTSKPRLIAIISLPLVLLAAYGASTFYQAQQEQEVFTQRIQGMGEYELCQLAATELVPYKMVATLMWLGILRCRGLVGEGANFKHGCPI